MRSANNCRLLCFPHLKWRNRCGRNIVDCPTVSFRQYARNVGIKFLLITCHLRFIFVTRKLKIILLASSNLGTFTLICRSFGFFSYDWRYKDSKRTYISWKLDNGNSHVSTLQLIYSDRHYFKLAKCADHKELKTSTYNVLFVRVSLDTLLDFPCMVLLSHTYCTHCITPPSPSPFHRLIVTLSQDMTNFGFSHV